LIFDWASPAVPVFDNFLCGQNAEVVAHLRRYAAGESTSSSLLLWGAAGSGRTHLMQASVASARADGRVAQSIGAENIPFDVEAGALYALDDVDHLSLDAQGTLFTFYNACRAAGAQLLLTAAFPAARLPLRDDLRTRIGAGLILEVRPLADADKPAALAAYAREQGFDLGADVIGYLLTRGRRDMGALIANLRALDRYSLAMKRPVTVPLVRELLLAPSRPIEARG
jgi:DnaA family protein